LSEASHFAIVTRDELWSLDRRTLVESRLSHGSADLHDNQIDARDDRDDELFDLCERECERVREILGALKEGRARAIVSAQRTDQAADVEATISISVLDLSIVTTPMHIAADYEMLVESFRSSGATARRRC
jgi:hypothetical protein